MSEKGLKELVSKWGIPGLKSVDLGLCDDCIFGKQKNVAFSNGERDLRNESL